MAHVGQEVGLGAGGGLGGVAGGGESVALAAGFGHVLKRAVDGHGDVVSSDDLAEGADPAVVAAGGDERQFDVEGVAALDGALEKPGYLGLCLGGVKGHGGG